MEKSSNPEHSINNEAKQREQRADVLLKFLDSAKNIEPLHGKKIEEVFSDEEQKRKFIDGLTEEEFVELLNGINGILRNKKKEEWGIDKGVIIQGLLLGTDYVSPQTADKLTLLEDVLLAAKEMNQKKRDLKDIALLVASSINAIHPYADGNGRTSRLVYLMLVKDFDDAVKKEIYQLLSSEGREKIDINPGFIREQIEDLIENEVGIKNPEINKDKITNLFYHASQEIEFKPGINESDKGYVLYLLDNDPYFINWSVFKYLNEKHINKEKYLKVRGPKVWPALRGTASIQAEAFFGDLDQENLSQIIQIYRDLKKEYIEKLIDCIAHPEKREYQIKYGGKNISFKEYFEEEIKRHAESTD